MSDQQGWRYYRYGLSDDPVYHRRRNGTSQLLRSRPLPGEPMSWIPQDDAYLSRYIERGEIALDETTRETIESEIGRPLPA